jgi:hypothetical protein
VARQGLNCTLSYSRAGSRQTYRVRAGALAHGVQMIASQDAARTQRAYYPHRTATERFSVVVLLKNWDERRDFTNWLASYGSYAIDPEVLQTPFPWMTVSVPSRQFLQYGVPLQGYEWGAHTGQMMFTPQVIFEAAASPGSSPSTPQVSSVINKWAAFGSDKAIQFFYPFGTQLAGSQAPANYSHIQYPGDPGSFSQQGTAVPTGPQPGPQPGKSVIPGT